MTIQNIIESIFTGAKEKQFRKILKDSFVFRSEKLLGSEYWNMESLADFCERVAKGRRISWYRRYTLPRLIVVLSVVFVLHLLMITRANNIGLFFKIISALGAPYIIVRTLMPSFFQDNLRELFLRRSKQFSEITQGLKIVKTESKVRIDLIADELEKFKNPTPEDIRKIVKKPFDELLTDEQLLKYWELKKEGFLEKKKKEQMFEEALIECMDREITQLQQL